MAVIVAILREIRNILLMVIHRDPGIAHGDGAQLAGNGTQEDQSIITKS